MWCVVYSDLQSARVSLWKDLCQAQDAVAETILDWAESRQADVHLLQADQAIHHLAAGRFDEAHKLFNICRDGQELLFIQEIQVQNFSAASVRANQILQRRKAKSARKNRPI